MENFIIIKGLKMRRDAFFDPRGYYYINIPPFHIPPPHCTPQLLAPLDAAAIAAASSSCLSQKKSQCQIGVVLEILLSTYNLLFYNRKLIKANQTISPTQNRTRCLVLYCQVWSWCQCVLFFHQHINTLYSSNEYTVTSFKF